MTTGCVQAATAAALLGALLTVQPAAAQESGRVTVDVEECLKLDSPAARGACFAAQVDQALEDGSSAEAADASRNDEAQRNRSATAQSNRSAAAQSAPAQRTAPAPQAAPARSAPAQSSGGIFASSPDNDTEYFGTIVDLRETVPNNYIITLDTGQIWEQAEPRKYPLRPGLEVRIYPTRWGSQYRLTSEEHGGQIKVKLRN